MASLFSIALSILSLALVLSSSSLAVSTDSHSEPLPLLLIPPAHAPVHSTAHVPAPAHSPTHYHHHYHHSTPAQAPALPPTHHHHHPPHSPSHAPAKSPTTLPARKYVAVQGVVFCKPCKYRGVQTLLGATPVLGAEVKLQCNNTKYSQVVKTKTDKNGYFFVQAPKTVTSYGAHKCKVSLVGSPDKNCDQPTDLYGGSSGAYLWADRRSVAESLAYDLFSAGPFAFEPAKSVNCSRVRRV